jgi:alginate O-acetyltransferase complex protein AlgI
VLFSSIDFLYYFLPLTFILYFGCPRRLRNLVLLLLSLFFYYYGEQGYVILLLFSSTYDYVFAAFIERVRGTWKAKALLFASVALNLSILGFFKYADFFILNLNALSGLDIALLNVPLPIGISFYTFQTMSYTIDVYRGLAKAHKEPISYATYVAMFPQLVAGPIVRYQTVADQLSIRVHSWEKFSYGTSRFVIGLAKKVIIANSLGELNVLAVGADNPTVLFYWLSAISFTLQIYFDFSGYSDMAIGLGRIFGFRFLENFNYPYISKSITEFWNRWHISLGTWFKEYVYIPLGGNRVSKLKWIRNIFIVWFLTGFWHGASWNFIIWGLYFGIILSLEKMFLKAFMDKRPAAVRHAYVLFAVLLGFVIFSFEDMGSMAIQLQGMFGLLSVPLTDAESLYYLRSYGFLLVLAAFGSTPIVKDLAVKSVNSEKVKKYLTVLEPAYYCLLLLVVTGYLVDSSFNPFLYFRF